MVIGSFFAGVGAAICSGISAVCSAIGGAVMSAVAVIAQKIPDVLVGSIGKIVIDIVKVLFGINHPDQPEEIALKAEKAKEEKDVKPEDFNSVEDYIKYLNEKITLDKEDQKKLESEEECLKYKKMGEGLYIQGIEEKKGIDLPMEFWITTNKMNLSSEETNELISSMKKSGFENAGVISDFAENKCLTKDEQMQVYAAISDSIQNRNPEFTDTDINKRVNEMCNKYEGKNE